MKKTILLFFLVLLAAPCLAMFSDDEKKNNKSNDGVKQTLTVSDSSKRRASAEGNEVRKTVYEIRFDANNALLLFTDGTEMTVDMQRIRLTLDYDESAGVGTVRLDDNEETRIYDLQGRHVEAENVREGVYIVNGKKVVIK